MDRLLISIELKINEDEPVIFDFPIMLEQLEYFCERVLNGHSTSQNSWVGPSNYFTRGEYESLISILLEMGILSWRNERHHNLGVDITKVGYLFLNSILDKKYKSEIITDDNESEFGYVYAILSNGLVKIGKTTDLFKRINAIKCSSPSPIKLLDVIETNNYHEIELALHKKFHLNRLNGEWFDLNIRDLLSEFAKYKIGMNIHKKQMDLFYVHQD